MRISGLRPVWRRKFVHATDSKHTMAVAPNVLNRQFEQALPNQVWVCDITYIRTKSGWLYLAAVLDLHSRKKMGWAMSPMMPADLVCAALQMAVVQRNSAPGLIVHSDRGTQYASAEHEPQRQCEPPRVSRRLFGLSQAGVSCSVVLCFSFA
jgi:putative transposase